MRGKLAVKGVLRGGVTSLLKAVTSVFDGEVFGYSGRDYRRRLEVGQALIRFGDSEAFCL
jgi:hypothetical protein